MTLETIKLQTTWNDAAGSINSNFSKILQVLASINGGGTGGGGIDEAELLEFLVENGYITEDYLADFYTKGQSDAKFATITAFESLSSKIGKIESAGYITSEALSPYLKTSDADSTFATITSLGGVDERLKEIEEYFNGSGEDADDKINKWNEIVAFLNATEDTTLAGILAAYTLKTDHNALATRVKTNEDTISGINTTLGSHSSTLSEHTTAINTIGNKVNPIDTWYNEVGKFFKKDSDGMWYVDGTGRFTNLITASAGISTPHITIGGITISVVDGVLKIDGNVYTTGQLGVGAVGQEGGGTGGGGVLLLNTWPTDGGSYAGYALGGNLGIDLNTRVKTLEGKATAVSFSQTLTSGKQIGVLTIDNVSNVLYAPSTYAWSEITSRPSKLSDFTDDVVAGKYLPLTGGTISGASVAPLIINTSSSESSVVFRINSDSKTQIGYNPYLGSFIYNYSSSKSIGIKDDGTPHYNGNTIYHAGNFNPADYLPLTGGTITRNLIIASANDSKIVLNETGGDYKYQLIEFQDHGTMYGVLGTMGSGDLVWNGSTLIHSGNIGSQSVASAGYATNAAKLAGYDITQVLPQILQSYRYIEAGTDLDTLIEENAGWWNSRDNTDYTNGPKQNFGLFSARINTSFFGQLAFGYSSSELMYRSQSWGSSGKFWESWKTIAFTDSNVASATKLATARTIWGQSFDGTGNVNGSINGDVADFQINANDGSARYNIIDADSNNAVLYFGYGSAPKSYKTRIAGETVILHYGTSKTTGFILNSSGNVTIGADDLALTTTKLYVDGGIRFSPRTLWGQSFDGTGDVDGNISTSGEVLLNHNKAIRMKGSNGTDYNVLFTSGTDLNIGYDSPVIRFGGSKMFINPSGNVTIGSSDLAGTSAKLYVDGQLSTPYYLSFRNASDSEFSYIGRGGSAEVLTIMTYGARNPLNFGTNSKTRMYINGDGNVGIGTTDPKAKLHVEGELRTYGDVFFFDSSGNNRITFTHASDIARIYNAGNSATMYIGEYNGNALNIVSYNVGIGTTSPAYKLDVAGSIRTTSTLTIGTIVLTDENGTLKIAGNAYTTGQLGAGEAGQPTSGGGSAILDYDSIVDALGFTPASSLQLTTLTNRVASLERKQQWELDSNGVAFTTDAGMVVPLGTPHILGLDDSGQCELTVGDDSYVTRLYGSSILVNDSEVLTKANTSFTRSYTSGTKIGTIKIGGTSTDIYAPASGSSSLWTTEYSIDVGNDVLAASKEYIGTNTIVGWDLAGSCLNDLYIGYDGYTIWMQGSVDEASDMRLKTVIDAVNLDIRDIAYAPIFNYVFKSRPQGRQMLGSSAQYWQTIAPKAVSENDKGNLAMNYGAIALASVVSVAKKVVTHEEEIAELKSKVQSLETRLAKYELN